MPIKNPQPYLFSLHIARISAIASCVLLCVVIILSILLWQLFPLKEVKPLFFAIDNADQKVVIVQSYEDIKTTSRNKVIMRYALKQYIEDRENIRDVDEKQRYKLTIKKSASAPAEQYNALMFADNNPRHIKGLTRTLEIASLGIKHSDEEYIYKKQRHTAETWKFIFDVTDTFAIEGQDTRKSTYKMEVIVKAIMLLQERITIEEAEMNPLGLLVLEYATQVIDNSTLKSKK